MKKKSPFAGVKLKNPKNTKTMKRFLYRSAKTGRIVTAVWAEKNPSTTIREKK